MNNFAILLKYEFKKIFQRKIVVISIAALFVLCAVSCGTHAVDMVYHYEVADMDSTGASHSSTDAAKTSLLTNIWAENRAITGSGTYINQAYLDHALISQHKMLADKDNFTYSDDDYLRYTKYPAFKKYSQPYTNAQNMLNFYYAKDPDNISYSGLLGLHLPTKVMPMDDLGSIKEADFYKTVKEYAMLDNKSVKTLGYTKAEVTYENQMERKIATPFKNVHISGYDAFFNSTYMTGIMLLVVIAICLIPIFSSEYGNQTDQIVLSARHGKGRLIAAKVTAGLILAAFLSLTLFALNLLAYMLLGGTSGAGAALQLLDHNSPYPITLLQAGIIIGLVRTAIALMFGGFCLVLSALIRTSFPALAVSIAALLLPLFANISPVTQRPLYQLLQLFPVKALSYDGIFSRYLFSVFGHVITPAVFYPIFALVILFLCMPLAYQGFKRHQVR